MLQHDPTRQASGRRALPPEALAGLREAFAGEVAARLPRLQALPAGSDADLAQAVRDAHALGSSAYVVGEQEAARSARALEAELLEHTAGTPLPPSAAAHVQALTVLLSPWLAA